MKLETNEGLIGWGEATLEGKAGAVMACIDDFREYIIGADPMQVEHHWQSMYVHSFYRAGPVIGSAISGIDQALWDLRGKILGLPVYKLLGGPFDARGVRGYYHAGGRTKEELARLRETAVSQGITCFKTGPAGRTFEWIDTHQKIDAAVKHLADAARRPRPRYRHRGRLPRQDQPHRGVDHRQGSGAAEPALRRGAVPAGEREGDGAHRPPAPRRRSPPASAWWRHSAAAS